MDEESTEMSCSEKEKTIENTGKNPIFSCCEVDKKKYATILIIIRKEITHSLTMTFIVMKQL